MRKDSTEPAQETEARSIIELCPIVSKAETKEEKNGGRARLRLRPTIKAVAATREREADVSQARD